MDPLDITSLHDEALLTTAEVAALFRINPGTLRNKRCQGRGPRGIRIGKSVRFKLRDVRSWIEAQADSDDERAPSQLAATANAQT